MTAPGDRGSPAALRSWITGCMLAILTFAACWTAAVCDWLAQEAAPGTGELLFFLFLLPGALLAAALAARQRIDADRASSEKPDDGAPHRVADTRLPPVA